MWLAGWSPDSSLWSYAAACVYLMLRSMSGALAATVCLTPTRGMRACARQVATGPDVTTLPSTLLLHGRTGLACNRKVRSPTSCSFKVLMMASRRPADVYLPAWDGSPTALDLAITGPTRSETFATAARCHWRPRRPMLHSRPPTSTRHKRVPARGAVSSALWAWEPTAAKLLARIARAAALREGVAAALQDQLLQELCVAIRSSRGRSVLSWRALPAPPFRCPSAVCVLLPSRLAGSAGLAQALASAAGVRLRLSNSAALLVSIFDSRGLPAVWSSTVGAFLVPWTWRVLSIPAQIPASKRPAASNLFLGSDSCHKQAGAFGCTYLGLVK